LIGLLGGSFDPVHLGHGHLAKTLLESFPFSSLYWVPSRQNPLKPNAPIATDSERFEMLQIAARSVNDSRLEVLDWELKRAAPSYSIDTIRFAQTTFQSTPYFILGNEVFSELAQWKEPQAILNLSHLIIVKRHEGMTNLEEILIKLESPDYVKTNTEYSAERWHNTRTDKSIYIVDIKALPYSATHIRNTVSKCWDNQTLDVTPDGLDKCVWHFIKEKRIYGRKTVSRH